MNAPNTSLILIAVALATAIVKSAIAGCRHAIRHAATQVASNCENRRARHLLPGGGSERRPCDPAVARLPDLFAHVPQPDPRAGRSLPYRRPRLPRVSATVHHPPPLSSSTPSTAWRRSSMRSLKRPGWDPVRLICAGLRGSGRLPTGRQAPRAGYGVGGSERQRLRRGAG